MNCAYRVIWNEALSAWTAVSELAAGKGKGGSAACGAVAVMLLASPAWADCSGTSAIVCSPSVVQTATVGSGPATTASTLTVLSGAVIATGDATGISFGDGATIDIQSGATVRNLAQDSGGLYGTGGNTIEFGSNNTLIIRAGARVSSEGVQTRGEAINPNGLDNRIFNDGTVSTVHSPSAIWLESGTGHTTIVNGATGVIDAAGGTGGILGVNGVMAVDFTNKGALLGSMNFAGGDDILRWHTGASITGAIGAGAGNNVLTLNGAGVDTFSQTISGFQRLEKQDSGTWTLGIALPGSDITHTTVSSGTLILGTDASTYGGTMNVTAAGILQSHAQFAPQAVANDGLVRFAQPTDASYAGLVSGAGGVEKTGAGRLTLTRDQTFTGPTTIGDGALRLGGGGTGGAVRGDIVNNAALEVDRSDALTLAGVISGTGSTRQLGAGTTTLVADNTYSGGTFIDHGVLQLGAGGTSGAIVGNVANRGVLAFNRSNALTFSGSISGAGAVEQRGSGIVALTGSNTYTGSTSVLAGTLRAGAANTLSGGSAHTVATGATLDLAGHDQTIAAMTNAGTVSLPGNAPGTTLTVHGPWVGSGGVLRLGTALGGSTSPTDRLVLNGPSAVASGHTNVQITNLGGLGALTTGNGIEVVTALNGASTASGAFALSAGHVDAGAYEYRLYDGDATGAGENWYLRSSTTATKLPPAVASGPLVVPTYRAEVPLFAGLPAQLRQGNLMMLGNLHQRVGDEQLVRDNAPGGSRRAWARLVGADIDIRQSGPVAPHSEGRLRGVQTGTDLFADGNWRAGLYVGRLEGDIGVSGFARGVTGRVGHNDLRSDYLGGYATYHHDSGFYADAVLQAGRHRYGVEPLANVSSSGKGHSALASIEVGQSFRLAERWSLEPQLQLVYQRLTLNDTAIAGARVQQQLDNGWTARAGVRLKGEYATELGTLQPYTRVNVYHASSGSDIARFVGPSGATDIDSSTGYTSAELAGGLTLALTPATSVYGEVGKLWSVGGDSRVESGVQGSVGLKVQW